jgi:hypothetical protein
VSKKGFNHNQSRGSESSLLGPGGAFDIKMKFMFVRLSMRTESLA